MLETPFKKAKPILEKIHRHGYEAYYVGGCVRDFLLKQPIGDIDITTSARPERIMEIFPKVIPVGAEHGTVIVRHEQESYEVTTFRVDGNYSDHRHPDMVTFISNLDKDLERRDFTINAMAMDINGKVIDIFGGKEDLAKKQIRTVGNGYDRFQEDPLRMLRAIRFSSQLGFSIEEETLQNIKRLKDQMNTIAVERITNEMEKMFAGKEVSNGIEYLIETEVYKFIPIFSEYPNIIHSIPKTLQPLHTLSEVISFLHLIHSDVSIGSLVNLWKCSNKTKQRAIQLAEAYHYYEKQGIDMWFVYKLPRSLYSNFIRLINNMNQHPIKEEELLSLYEKLPIQSRKELAVNGNDLLQLFPHLKKGPWIQKKLNEIEKQIVFGKLNNTNENIKEWISCHPPE